MENNSCASQVNLRLVTAAYNGDISTNDPVDGKGKPDRVDFYLVTRLYFQFLSLIPHIPLTQLLNTGCSKEGLI